jgi:hypothetical protein
MGSFNFGYGGGSPVSLADAIAEAYATARNISLAQVPVTWIQDAVIHGDETALDIDIAAITRRLS